MRRGRAPSPSPSSCSGIPRKGRSRASRPKRGSCTTQRRSTLRYRPSTPSRTGSSASARAATRIRRATGSASSSTPFHDRRTAYEFAVNPSGVKLDRYWYNDNNNDESWDAVWDVAVSRDQQGWTRGVPHPVFTASVQSRPTQHVRLRGRPAHRPAERNRHVAAAVEERERLCVVVRRARRPVDEPVAEAARARALHRRRPEDAGSRAGQPARRTPLIPTASSGLDLKYAVTPGPDAHRRPSTPTSARSKRIRRSSTSSASKRSFPSGGRSSSKAPAPSTSISTATTALHRPVLFAADRPVAAGHARPAGRRRLHRAPAQTTILGAAKLTGRVGTFSIGAMQAVTPKKNAVIVNGSRRTPSRSSRSTSYTVGRARREFTNQSSVGFMATATNAAGSTTATRFLPGRPTPAASTGTGASRSDTRSRATWRAAVCTAMPRRSTTLQQQQPSTTSSVRTRPRSTTIPRGRR